MSKSIEKANYLIKLRRMDLVVRLEAQVLEAQKLERESKTKIKGNVVIIKKTR